MEIIFCCILTWKYFYSDISSFRDTDKERKIKENFTLIPIALICSAVLFATLIIGFIYIVYKIYSNEIYFLEKLINFNSPNFDGYLKSLEDIKKRLRLESEEDEDKDDDMDIESKKTAKKEEEEEKSKKKKKAEEKVEEKKKKKKDKKSNKFMQVKQKKKIIMGMFFFKSNLYIKVSTNKKRLQKKHSSTNEQICYKEDFILLVNMIMVIVL